MNALEPTDVKSANNVIKRKLLIDKLSAPFFYSYINALQLMKKSLLKNSITTNSYIFLLYASFSSAFRCAQRWADPLLVTSTQLLLQLKVY